MHRLGFAVLLIATTVACERSQTSTPPEPAPAETPADAPAEPANEALAEPEEPEEPAVESQPAQEPEISEVKQPVFEKDGFLARDLVCSLTVPTRGADRYIAAGLVDADAALDACAPKGAAVDVTWGYVSGQARNVSVDAETSKLANCVMKAMEQVRAGVEAECRAVLLIGDPVCAAAAYEAR